MYICVCCVSEKGKRFSLTWTYTIRDFKKTAALFQLKKVFGTALKV